MLREAAFAGADTAGLGVGPRLGRDDVAFVADDEAQTRADGVDGIGVGAVVRVLDDGVQTTGGAAADVRRAGVGFCFVTPNRPWGSSINRGRFDGPLASTGFSTTFILGGTVVAAIGIGETDAGVAVGEDERARELRHATTDEIARGAIADEGRQTGGEELDWDGFTRGMPDWFDGMQRSVGLLRNGEASNNSGAPTVSSNM